GPDITGLNSTYVKRASRKSAAVLVPTGEKMMANALDAFAIGGKVAIVTGAGARANSIGEVYALALADAGARIIVADLDADGAHGVAAKIKDNGGDAIGVGIDITDEASVAAKVKTACD